MRLATSLQPPTLTAWPVPPDVSAWRPIAVQAEEPHARLLSRT